MLTSAKNLKKVSKEVSKYESPEESYVYPQTERDSSPRAKANSSLNS